MLYLCEREIGFDTTSLGFPSVHGCRAVVLVTAGGLFGYHLNGSLSAEKEQRLGQFVSGHQQGGAKRTLYVAGKLGGDGAYSNLDQARAEVDRLAQAVGFDGTCYWADLSHIAGGSAYVVFDSLQNTTCIITARAWNHGVDGAPGNRGPYVALNRAIANGSAPSQMVVNINPAGLTAVYPTKVS